MADDVAVREARDDEALGVRRVLDAAMLETDAVDEAVARGDAFVAVIDGRVLGTLVLVPHAAVDQPAGLGEDEAEAAGIEAEGAGIEAEAVGMHVDAVAVRRRRRGQGIGRALVAAALSRETRLTVAFDPGIARFYDALGFETVAVEGGDESGERRWAVRALDD